MLYTGKEQTTEIGHNPAVNNNLGLATCSKGAKIGYYFGVIVSFGIMYVVWSIPKSNTLNKMQLKINESASGIDIQLQKRFDTLTKLVDALKSQVKFEKETLEAITAYRSGMNVSNDTNKKPLELNQKAMNIEKISTGINMAFEAYPQLQSNESFRKLMNESTMIEKEIAAARRLYNSNVTAFNEMIFTFPAKVIASNKKMSGIPLFEASQKVKADVKLTI